MSKKTKKKIRKWRIQFEIEDDGKYQDECYGKTYVGYIKKSWIMDSIKDYLNKICLWQGKYKNLKIKGVNKCPKKKKRK